jgi:threonine/homoserine/homoserine lactone efflux protein
VDSLLFAYITFTFVLVVTPGSTTAVVVRNTLAGGRAGGLGAAAGAALANSLHATAAGFGLAVVFARWPAALTALRVAGALYLGWLGAASLYRVAGRPDGGLRLTSGDAIARSAMTGALRQGLAVNLLNPAIATFYLVVVPSFMPAGASSWRFAALAAIHVAMAFTCHSLWAIGLDRIRELLRPPLARRVLEGATGVALIGLAVRVLIR